MTEDKLRSLEKTTGAFRSAIDAAKCAGESRIEWLMRFPKDCCDLASMVLALYLHRQGFQQIYWMKADVPVHSRSSCQSQHVWLQVDGVNVDVTADQFEAEGNRVIVAHSSRFHLALRNPTSEPIDAECDGSSFLQRLANCNVMTEWLDALLDYLDS